MILHRIAIVLAVLASLQAFSFAADRPPTIAVMGYLKVPGMYELDKGMTILRAVEKAGGVNHQGDLMVVVSRKINAKLTQEIRFSSLAALKENPKADIDLQANDVVVITTPENAMPEKK